MLSGILLRSKEWICLSCFGIWNVNPCSDFFATSKRMLWTYTGGSVWSRPQRSDSPRNPTFRWEQADNFHNAQKGGLGRLQIFPGARPSWSHSLCRAAWEHKGESEASLHIARKLLVHMWTQTWTAYDDSLTEGAWLIKADWHNPACFQSSLSSSMPSSSCRVHVRIIKCETSHWLFHNQSNALINSFSMSSLQLSWLIVGEHGWGSRANTTEI